MSLRYKVKWLLAADVLLGCVLAGAQSDRPLPRPPAVPSPPGARSNSAPSRQLRWLRNDGQLLASSQPHRAYSVGIPAWEPAAHPSIPDTGLEFAGQGAHLDLTRFFAAMNRPAAEAGSHSEGEPAAHYSVKGLLWQSLAFTGIENVYRIGTDRYMRYQTAHGPYWANYMISMQHWDMTRWSDGDDFVVDDIGHPMQGAVSGFIEVQNSPSQRVLQVGKSRAYWRSRFLAMMWATVFSTQQKIGPLGEAALGNDGGYTYVPGCRYGCPTWHPGKTYLNNTGWTDFIMTPVGGTAWMVMEDVIDREIGDRLQRSFPHPVFDNIVRGALNPTRAMANFVRWRTPWYRDFQHYPIDRHITPGIHFIPGDEETASRAPRFELFPHFDGIFLPVNTASCTACRRMISGYGVGFAARLAQWVDFDSDLDFHPHAGPLPSDRSGGSAIIGTFGVRTGLQYAHYALKVSLRPGFLSYSDAYQLDPATGIPTTNTGRVTHFVTAMAINSDYDVSRHFGLRAVFGNTPVRYRKPNPGPAGIGSPPYLVWLSHEYFVTNENWDFQTGVILRF